jgi:phosphoribosylformimino-5-aminoimidazole carboxamide ribotide isomerase
MIFLPAIDIRDGKAVRLEQGRFDKETVYVDDPLEAARSWVEAGARSLHVVDLDGARDGKPQNLEHLRRITDELRIPVQYGGGLRSIVSAREALAAGATRVVLGTAAYNDTEFLDEAVRNWGVRVVVAIDVRGGHVSVSGWTETSQALAEDVIRRMQNRGVKQFVYTNADRDGMLNGPDLDEVKRIADVIRGRWIYSGGIASIEDLQALRDLRLTNLAGIISGKAIYEGRFTIPEAHDVLDVSGERPANNASAA